MTHPSPSSADQGTFDLDRALARLSGRKRLLVLPHDHPDPDSLAAAEGLRLLIERELGIPGTIALSGLIGRAENRAMVELLDIPLTSLHRLNVDLFDIVALIDTQPGTGNNALPESLHADIVVDHRPHRVVYADTSWCDIRAGLGASSTIVYGYLKARNYPWDARLASAFLYALKSETRDLGREATAAEREAYLDLIKIADHALIDRITHPKVSRPYYAALDRALQRGRLYGKLLAVNLGPLAYPDLVAELADMLLPCADAHWVVCMGVHESVAYLSLRTDEPDAEAGALIRLIVGNKGASGGHDMMAGGRLYAAMEDAGKLQRAFEDIVAGLCRALKIEQLTPEPLLRPQDQGDGLKI